LRIILLAFLHVTYASLMIVVKAIAILATSGSVSLSCSRLDCVRERCRCRDAFNHVVVY